MHRNGSIPGSHSEENLEVSPIQQISQHQELDPLENSVCGLMFAQAVECVLGVNIGVLLSGIQGVSPLLSEFCFPSWL